MEKTAFEMGVESAIVKIAKASTRIIHGLAGSIPGSLIGSSIGGPVGAVYDEDNRLRGFLAGTAMGALGGAGAGGLASSLLMRPRTAKRHAAILKRMLEGKRPHESHVKDLASRGAKTLIVGTAAGTPAGYYAAKHVARGKKDKGDK